MTEEATTLHEQVAAANVEATVSTSVDEQVGIEATAPTEGKEQAPVTEPTEPQAVDASTASAGESI
jgi:hypothetical protein